MLCTNCGTSNTDSAEKCVMCGAVLEKSNEAAYQKLLNRLSDENDPLTPEPYEKILGAAFMICSPLFLIVGLILGGKFLFLLAAAVFALISGVMARYPAEWWEVAKPRFTVTAYPTDHWKSMNRFNYWILFMLSFIICVVAVVV